MSDRLRIGVIGLGAFGRLHAQTLVGLAEADLCALVARRQESIDALRDDCPDAKGFTDLDQAIAESGADAWVVASSTHTHVEMTRKLLDAGKIVLLEKPISEDLAEAESLAPHVADDSSNLMIGHILLFNSELLALLDEVKTRGPLQYIHCFRHRGVGHMAQFAGESPFHLTMVHDLYCVQALMGGAEPVAFTAQQHVHKSGNPDLALAQLKFPDGAIAAFSACFMVPEGGGEQGFDRMEVYGDGWMARLLPNPRPIKLWDNQKQQHPMDLEIRAGLGAPTGMLAEQLRCFCRVARGKQTVPAGATYHDAMQVQRWLDKLTACAT